MLTDEVDAARTCANDAEKCNGRLLTPDDKDMDSDDVSFVQLRKMKALSETSVGKMTRAFLDRLERDIHTFASSGSMFTLVAQFNVKEDGCDKFEELRLANAEEVQAAEPGTLLFQLCKDPTVKGKYYMIEMYQDMAALQTHFKNLQEQFQTAMSELLTGEAPSIKLSNVLAPPGLKPGKAGVAILAEFPVQPGKENDFENAWLPIIDDVHEKEAGNLLYAFGRDVQDSSTYGFTELYAEMSDVVAHGDTDYFKAAQPHWAPTLRGTPTVTILQVVGDSSKKPTLVASNL